MAVDIRWLDQAKDDILSILAYISFDNPKAAAAYVSAIEKSCEKLSQFPESGRVFNETYRVLVIRKSRCSVSIRRWRKESHRSEGD